MKKRIIAATLGVILLMSAITGCGSSSKTEKLDENGDAVVSLDLFADFVWLSTDSWSGIIPDKITEKTGTSFNVTRATDANQLGVMIASGELPDVIFTDSLLDRLSDPDLCYSYNELIEEYGLDWKPDKERIMIAKSKNLDENDENYYTLMSYYNTKEEWEKAVDVVAPAVGSLYYRKDIWEALGSPTMDTQEDIVKVLEMVKENYPDVIPLSGGGHTWRFAAFLEYKGSRNSFMYDANNEVKYLDTTENFYEYLKYVNTLYQKGLFPEENLAMTNEEDAKQQFTIGKCFMYEWTGRTSNVAQLETMLTRNVPEGEVAIVPIPDDSEIIQIGMAGWAGVFISKNCKDPEAAIKMIEYLNSAEGRRMLVWGEEGKEYTLDEKDMPIFTEEWIEATKDEAIFNTKYNPNFLMTNTAIDELKTFYSGADQEVVDALLKNSDKVRQHPELTMIIPHASSDIGIIYTKIQETRKAELMKLYTAPDDEAFERTYKKYLELLEAMGVDKLNDYAKVQVEKVLKGFN